LIVIITYSKEPSQEKGTKQKRSYSAEDEKESRPEICWEIWGYGREVTGYRGEVLIDERERGGDDDSGSEIGEEREGSEVLYRTAQFAGNNRGCSGSRHDKTHEKSLRQNSIMREGDDDGINNET